MRPRLKLLQTICREAANGFETPLRGSPNKPPAFGAFLPDGTFVPLPPVPEGLLVEGFRRAVLEFLVRQQGLSEELRGRMLGWRYSGFSAHNQVRVTAGDPEGRKKLAGFMLRAPMSLEKMRYDAETGTVIYRSKMHLGLLQPHAMERSPPVPSDAWPLNSVLPLTYHRAPTSRNQGARPTAGQPRASLSERVSHSARVRAFALVRALTHCQSCGIGGKRPPNPMLRVRRWAHASCDRRACGKRA